MSDVNLLLRYQRAELEQAERFHIFVIGFQLAIALLAACSVFVTNANALVLLAMVAAVLGVVWLWVDWFYRKHRSAGDQARRVVLLASGLGEWPSDVSNLIARFDASVKNVQADVAQYFASRSPAGVQRLAEMIEESAFFTGQLQKRSSEVMLFGVALSIAVLLAIWLSVFQLAQGDAVLAVARVTLAFLVFLLSADVFGRVFGHYGASAEMERIRLRIDAARARAFPNADVMLLMADYNAVVEAAPMVVPGVYRKQSDRLNEAWGLYKSARGMTGC